MTIRFINPETDDVLDIIETGGRIERIADDCARVARVLRVCGVGQFIVHCPRLHKRLFGHAGDGIVAKYTLGSTEHGSWMPECASHWLKLWGC